MKEALSIIILTCSVLCLQAQTLVTCKSNKSFWVYENGEDIYAVEIEGDVKESDRTNLVSVNNGALQLLVVDKTPFLEGQQESNDLKILMQYASKEGQYLSEMMKTDLDIQMMQSSFSSDRTVLIWYYPMPAGTSSQVTFQVYANTIIDGYVYGLASPVFTGQTFDEVRKFLMDTISTLQKLKSKKEIKKLCEK
jgi:hypothetical protein